MRHGQDRGSQRYLSPHGAERGIESGDFRKVSLQHVVIDAFMLGYGFASGATDLEKCHDVGVARVQADPAMGRHFAAAEFE